MSSFYIPPPDPDFELAAMIEHERAVAELAKAPNPCGCQTREGHVDPVLDPEIGLGHGERSELNDDPLPHYVPGTGGFNGLYTQLPDAYCLCGHPSYMTCMGNLLHGLGSMTISRPDGGEVL